MFNVFDIFLDFSFIWQAPHMNWGTLNHCRCQMRAKLSQPKQEKILSHSSTKIILLVGLLPVRWWVAVACRHLVHLLRRNFYCRFKNENLLMRQGREWRSQLRFCDAKFTRKSFHLNYVHWIHCILPLAIWRNRFSFFRTHFVLCRFQIYWTIIIIRALISLLTHSTCSLCIRWSQLCLRCVRIVCASEFRGQACVSHSQCARVWDLAQSALMQCAMASNLLLPKARRLDSIKFIEKLIRKDEVRLA